MSLEFWPFGYKAYRSSSSVDEDRLFLRTARVVWADWNAADWCCKPQGALLRSREKAPYVVMSTHYTTDFQTAPHYDLKLQPFSR